MSLFYLVKKYDRVGFSSYRFGKLTALLISDISWRRTDKTAHAEFLHVLRHINTNHAVFIVKQSLGKSLCKLRLTNTGRT